jgi:hypothetical protein
MGSARGRFSGLSERAASVSGAEVQRGEELFENEIVNMF